jgi:hypothetical protein
LAPRALAALLACCPMAGCAWLPSELNLAPLWFHRLDENGEVLEWDLLWPIVHYERTPEGGDDFRIRPLWRRVTEPEAAAVEHQFLVPLGVVRSDPHESSQRLFPLWNWRSKEDQDGFRDVDWYALFPFLWGGSNERGDEDYFAFLPFWADIPQFLSYDRFRTILFPLWVRLDKDGHRHQMLLWPLIGWSSCAEGSHHWFRVAPFYGHDVEDGRFDRRFLLWPFFHWGWENLDMADPVWTFWFWPFVGVQSGRTASGLAILWPFFEQTQLDDRNYKLNVLWPFFHYRESRIEQNLVQWWLWPFVGHAHSDDQNSWSFLWPLIWWRRYDDPDSTTEQEWILPLFWHIRQTREDGAERDYVKLWPLAHRTVATDGDGKTVGGDWSLLSPIPWRDGNATGIEETYGFLWQIAAGRQRAPDDHGLDVLGRVFTRRARGARTTASVPFLFNYERDGNGTVLRLLQFLPIRLGGAP